MKFSWPSTTSGLAPCVQSNGRGRTDAMAFGSIQRTATSRAESATSTRRRTLTVGESCTSTDAAVPITRWFVAMSPFASTTNPDAWVVGVHSATTLSCHWERRNEGSDFNGAHQRRRRGPRGLDFRVARSTRGPRRRPRRSLRSASTSRRCPGTRPAGPIPPCSSRAQPTSAVPSSAVTTSRGDALGGLSLTRRAWRGTGAASPQGRPAPPLYEGRLATGRPRAACRRRASRAPERAA